MNHSCDPNCFTTPCGLEIAVRDIEARDELTNDYAELGVRKDERLSCPCDSVSYRGTISPDDVQDLRTQWALLLDSALLHLHGVELPLWRLLPDDVKRTLARVPELVLNLDESEC